MSALGISLQIAAIADPAEPQSNARQVQQLERLAAWFRESQVPYPVTDSGLSVCVRGRSFRGKEDLTIVEEGILVARAGPDAVVYTDEMRLLTVSPRIGDITVSFKEKKITEIIRQRLDSPESYRQSDIRGYCWERGIEFGDLRSSHSMELPCRELLLAYWCLALGEAELRDRLLDRFSQDAKYDDSMDIQSFCCDRMGACFRDRAIVSLADMRNTQNEVADRIEWVEKAFWKDVDTPSDSSELILRLRQTARIPSKTFGGPSQLSVDLLVRSLCQQRCEDSFRDLGASEYLFIDSGHSSPAAELLGMGEVAVPALINAVGNETPTRHVLDGRNLKNGLAVATVGGMAVDILERILGTPRLPYSRDPVSADEIQRTQAAFRDQLEQKRAK